MVMADSVMVLPSTEMKKYEGAEEAGELVDSLEHPF